MQKPSRISLNYILEYADPIKVDKTLENIIM